MEQIMLSKSKKIIKFSKEGCIPCKMVGDFLNSNEIKFEEINPFDNPKLAEKFDIMSVPVLILLEEEKEISRVIGYNENSLKELIEEFKK